MRIRVATASLGLFGLLLVPSLSAQDGGVELGIDAGFTISIPDEGDNLTSLSVPLQRLRAGFFLSDAMALEPAIAFNVLSGGGSTLTTISASASLLYHLSTDPTASRIYVRGGAGIVYIDADGSASQFGIEGGLGVKTAGEPIFLRFEGVFGYNFENDDFQSSIDIGALAGISVVTG